MSGLQDWEEACQDVACAAAVLCCLRGPRGEAWGVLVVGGAGGAGGAVRVAWVDGVEAWGAVVRVGAWGIWVVGEVLVVARALVVVGVEGWGVGEGAWGWVMTGHQVGWEVVAGAAWGWVVAGVVVAQALAEVLAWAVAWAWVVGVAWVAAWG
jgi:hypothetical protein